MNSSNGVMGSIWAPLYGQARNNSRRAREIGVWAEQERANHATCFGTERRFLCEELECPWRAECLALCAEWRR